MFKQLRGFLPETVYNETAKGMLNDFYPRALQWCSTVDIPDNVVNVDIYKSYPNVLLNNTHPLPLKSIHDVVEKFNCKSDLNQCGEFYIDETVMVRYSVQSQSHRKKLRNHN